MIFDILSDIKKTLSDSTVASGCFLSFIPSKDGKNTDFGVYITLLNLNENTANKIPYSYKKNNADQYQTRNPSLQLDLYIMISAYNDYYDESLKSIGKVIQAFVNNYHFRLAGGNIEYSLQMVNLSMEQNNNLWQALSNNILPHVIYKVRSIIVDPETVTEPAYGAVSEIGLKTVSV